MTRKEFAAQMSGLETMCLAMHGKSALADDVVEVYWRILGGFAVEQFVAAVTALLKDWRWPRMPMPSEILERIPDLTYDDEAESALNAVRYRAMYVDRFDESVLPSLDAVAVDLLVDGFGSVESGLDAFRRAERRTSGGRLHRRFLRAHEMRRKIGLLSDGRTVDEAWPETSVDPWRTDRHIRRIVGGGGEREDNETARKRSHQRERLRKG